MSETPLQPQMPHSYADGLAELEGILDYLRGDQVDLEAMAEKVERAGQLIRFCRQRLDNVSVQVDQVLESIQTDLPNDG